MIVSCTAYNPAVYSSYDPLNPGEQVRQNPVGHIEWSEELGAYVIVWDTTTGFTPDKSGKYFVINSAFVIWVDELQKEIEKLRK